MAKKGTLYEKLVSEVIRGFYPKAKVEQGVWVRGPDGTRDMDVLVSGKLNGEDVKILIECKDYNPNSTGKVGIEKVDGLESKSRDLEIDYSIICTNAGFTSDAINKAMRVGIGMISVMRKGDKRVRFLVNEEIYTRRIKLEKTILSLYNNSGDIDLSKLGYPLPIYFKGLPLGNWINLKITEAITQNPIVNGNFNITSKLVVPQIFQIYEKDIAVTEIDFSFIISGNWFAHQVELDATEGIYDWLSHRILLNTGIKENQIEIKNLDVVAGGKIIQYPPNIEKFHELPVGESNMDISILLINGLPEPVPDKIPDLNIFIDKKDLVLIIKNLPETAFRSKDI